MDILILKVGLKWNVQGTPYQLNIYLVLYIFTNQLFKKVINYIIIYDNIIMFIIFILYTYITR